MSGTPVAVVGAGLAGLRCAVELQRFGLSPTVFEASDGIGGRVRTDTVDGFRLDRGFQVLLTDYPEARRNFDYEGLRLGEFRPGARIWTGESFATLADPLRAPNTIAASLTSPVATPGDLWRLFRMKRDLAGSDPKQILRRPDLPAIDSLERRGFSSTIIESFFRPFFGGVLLDPDLATSSRLMEIYFRCFAGGGAALPEGGMGALAEQLAGQLPEGTVRLNSTATGAGPGGVQLEDGMRFEAGAVVVATDETAAGGLCDLEPPTGNRVTTCVYFDAPEEDSGGSWLVLSPAGLGPINELAFPSSVAAGYAPAGRSLVSASVLGDQCDRPDLLEAVRAQLGEWYGDPTVAGWRHLRSYRIERALPSFPPGRMRLNGLPPKLGPGVYVCGDFRETPSIQGALVSGRKTAAAVAADL